MPYLQLTVRIRSKGAYNQGPHNNMKLSGAEERSTHSYIDRLNVLDLSVQTQHICVAPNFMLKQKVLQQSKPSLPPDFELPRIGTHWGHPFN